jgi:hypothetical protein
MHGFKPGLKAENIAYLKNWLILVDQSLLLFPVSLVASG